VQSLNSIDDQDFPFPIGWYSKPRLALLSSSIDIKFPVCRYRTKHDFPDCEAPITLQARTVILAGCNPPPRKAAFQMFYSNCKSTMQREIIISVSVNNNRLQQKNNSVIALIRTRLISQQMFTPHSHSLPHFFRYFHSS